VLQVPDRGPSGSGSKEKNLLGDPLQDIKHYLDLEKVGCNTGKGRHENRDDKRKYAESEKNEMRRVHKKSKNKMGKEKGRRRTKRSSGCDSSSEVSKLFLSSFKLWYLGWTAAVVWWSEFLLKTKVQELLYRFICH
jgi:hypothetical protein